MIIRIILLLMGDYLAYAKRSVNFFFFVNWVIVMNLDDTWKFMYESWIRKYLSLRNLLLRIFSQFFFFVQKNVVVQDIPEWNNLQQAVHSRCTSKCLQCLDNDSYDKQFRNCSPYMIPLLVGWSREVSAIGS